MRALAIVLLTSLIATGAARAQEAGDAPSAELPLDANSDAPVASDTAPAPAITERASAELGSPFGAPSTPEVEPAREPRRRIRTFEIAIPFSIGLVGGFFGTGAHGEVGTGALGLAFYARLTAWASLGARILLSSLGASSIGGVAIAGGLSLPSVRFSFREELDSIVAIECGVHVEAGFFGGNYHSLLGSGAFGFGGGFDVALDLGPSNAIVLDVVVNGWGAHGGYSAWTLLSLGYAVRFD